MDMDIFQLPDYFYDVNIISTTFRLFLAVLLGGIIGLERGANNHPAGFRTHILVCVGATLAMLTDQYILQNLISTADPARLGAQVITGVGFLGVGIIFVTGKHRIKGLTTAAGLWASACLGLALGIGFYSGAFMGGFLIFISLSFLSKIETYFRCRSRKINLYMEIATLEEYKMLVSKLKNMDINVLESHVSGTGPIASKGIAFYLSIRIPKGTIFSHIFDTLYALDGVLLLEEL